MLLVTGIYAFRTVAAEKVLVELHVAEFFQHRHTLFLGATGIHGAFVNNDAAGLNDFTDSFACFIKRSKIRAVVTIHRSRNGNDEYIPITKIFRIVSKLKVDRRLQIFS